MATDLTNLTANININVNIAATKDNSLSSASQAIDSILLTSNHIYTFGTGAGQADQAFGSAVLLTDGSLDIDLTADLKNGHGDTCNFSSIKMIMIVNEGPNGVIVAPSTANGCELFFEGADGITLGVDDVRLFTGDWTVTGGTGGTSHINFTNVGGTDVTSGDDTIVKLIVLGINA